MKRENTIFAPLNKNKTMHNIFRRQQTKLLESKVLVHTSVRNILEMWIVHDVVSNFQLYEHGKVHLAVTMTVIELSLW